GPPIAAEDLPAALHHEARHRACVAEDDDRPTLLVDPGARADLPFDDQVAAAHCRARQRARIALDHDDARHHVLAGRPADPAADMDLGAIDQAAAEVAQGALEIDLAAGEDADSERMLRTRVLNGYLLDPFLVEKPTELQ